MKRLVCYTAVGAAVLAVIATPAFAVSAVTTEGAFASAFGANYMRLDGRADTVDCPSGQKLGLGFQYATAAAYGAGPYNGYSAFQDTYSVSAPQGTTLDLGGLTTGTTYHFRLIGWCRTDFAAEEPGPSDSIVSGADLTFVCCTSGGGGGGGGGDTTGTAITITTPPVGATYQKGADVTPAFTCTDAESTVTQCSGSADKLPTAQVGKQTFTVTAKNSDGVTSSLSRDYEVTETAAADSTPPTISIMTPPAGASYKQGTSVTAVYSCTDPESGVTQCSSGRYADNLDTSSEGAHTLTITAKNGAGLTGTLSREYTVTSSKTVGGTYGSGPKVVEDTSWFPSSCDPSSSTFNVLTCLGDGWNRLSAAAKNLWASLWPAKQGLGVVDGKGLPAGFEYQNGNVIAVGGGNVIAVGAGHVINVGAGHVIAVGAGHVIATGAGHVVGCNECKVTDAGGNVIAVGAGHVIAVGAGHVINVGAGHVINVGAGHRPLARSAAAQFATLVKSDTHNVVAPAAGVMTEKLSLKRTQLGTGKAAFAHAGVKQLTLKLSKKGLKVLGKLAAANRKLAAAGKGPRAVKLTLTTTFTPTRGKASTQRKTFKVTPGAA